jgi:hypothetical protein
MANAGPKSPLGAIATIYLVVVFFWLRKGVKKNSGCHACQRIESTARDRLVFDRFNHRTAVELSVFNNPSRGRKFKLGRYPAGGVSQVCR